MKPLKYEDMNIYDQAVERPNGDKVRLVLILHADGTVNGYVESYSDEFNVLADIVPVKK